MRLPLDPAAAYRAVSGRDTRWDGRLYLGVTSTGIYCRPSCPARTPRPENCRWFPTAAAAVAAGFRACRRCRPDAVPGSRQWDARLDLVSRAVRLIADGVLDDGGVAALAARLGVSSRHLHRLLVREVGAGPQQLGQTRRAQTARTLIEQTSLTLADIAFAAGFGSIRQFNDVIRAEFGTSPGVLRGNTRIAAAVDGREAVEGPSLSLRLVFRPPLAREPLRRTLAAHAIAGVERVDGAVHTRIVRAPAGPAVVEIDFAAQYASTIRVRLGLTSLADLMPVVTRLRRWLDLDADPCLVDGHLGMDPILARFVAAHPGLRVPGAVDGAELAVCAVLGQQVTLAGAKTLQGRIAARFGTPVPAASGPGGVPGPVVFPTAARLSEAGPEAIRDAANLTASRARAVHALATAIVGGLDLTPGTDRAVVRTRLLAIPGIGPWTVDYITLRALHDPDAFIGSDLVLRRALAAVHRVDRAALTAAIAERHSAPWRPWRSYALQHLWTSEVYS